MSDRPPASSDLVTGEAVVLDVQLAQLPIRAVALLIDLVVQGLLFVGALILVLSTLEVADPALVSALLILFVVLVLVGYPIVFESLTRGKSLGKLVLGLRVVSDDGGPERFRQAVFRALAGFIEIYMFTGGPAVIASLASSKGKRLGDIFAGTVVITERAPKAVAPPPPMPPGLGGWASTLELSQLSDDLVATARQYLSRWYQLTPMTQHEMGLRIAGAVSAVVAPPPPPGVPPHAYLAAVLAERRRREEIRLASQAANQQAANQQAANQQAANQQAANQSAAAQAAQAAAQAATHSAAAHSATAQRTPPPSPPAPGGYTAPEPPASPNPGGYVPPEPPAGPSPGGYTAPEPPASPNPGGFVPPA